MSFLYVKAYHGRCTSFDSWIHKPQFLHGLKDRLQQLGFRVDLIPVEGIDVCILEICGHSVFHCNLKNLKFNTHYDRDVVCQRAIQAVIDSSYKFSRARSCLWLWTLMDHQLFRRSKYAPQDFWVKEIKMREFPSFTECVDCCQILVKKSEVNDEIKT